MKCNNCGSENPMGSYYCGNCQFPMQMFTNTPGNVTPHPNPGMNRNNPTPGINNPIPNTYAVKNSKTNIIIITAVVSIFVASTIMYLFTRQTSDKEKNGLSDSTNAVQNVDSSPNSGRESNGQKREDLLRSKSNSQQSNSTYMPPTRNESSSYNYSSSDVRSFLSGYSNSLLHGTYRDHASLYASSTYFLTDQIRSRSEIERMAKNFYNTYETTEHYFSIESITPLDNGDISVIVVEHQSTRRYSDSKTSSAVQRKLVVLTRENGSLKSYRQKNL